MKPFIRIRVYILTESQGEWWENLCSDLSTSRWKHGKAELKSDAHFPSVADAIAYGREHFKRFRVETLSPPVPPSITWQCNVNFETP